MELAHKNVESVSSAGDCSAGSRVDHLRQTLWNVKGSIRSGYDVVRIISAFVLLTAAGLKAYQLSTEPVFGTSILDARWLLMLTIEFELFFGLWLLSGLLPRLTWATAIGLFGLFTCVSVYKALVGAASCGCFGRVEVNPWYTVLLDLAIVMSLLYWRPRQLPSPACGRGAGGEGVPATTYARLTAILVLWSAVGLPVAYAVAGYTDTTLSDSGDIIGDRDTVVLSPETWIGKPFPLLGYIDTGNMLRKGTWVVLLYHHDCSVCCDVVPKYQALARKFTEKHTSPRVALIECPPYNQSIELANDNRTWSDGRLNDSRRWVVTTPLSLILENGTVSSVLHDTQPDLLEKIWLGCLRTNAKVAIGENRFVYQPLFFARERLGNAGECVEGVCDNHLRLCGYNER